MYAYTRLSWLTMNCIVSVNDNDYHMITGVLGRERKQKALESSLDWSEFAHCEHLKYSSTYTLQCSPRSWTFRFTHHPSPSDEGFLGSNLTITLPSCLLFGKFRWQASLIFKIDSIICHGRSMERTVYRKFRNSFWAPQESR